MKIGIVGSGNMGRTLGLAWAKKGHEVFFGSRNEHDLALLEQLAKGLLHGTIGEAIDFGDVLLYCLRDTLPSAVAEASRWQGKIIIDCNNQPIPDDFNYPPVVESFTEKYQADMPDARVVKALNANSQETYFHSAETISQNHVLCFMAGDDASAKQVVGELLEQLGFTPLDAGQAFNAKLLESFGDLVRMLMSKAGPFLTFSSQVLPTLERTGPEARQASKYK